MSHLHSVHLKLREYNCWCSHINTTGSDQKVCLLGVLCPLHSVHLKLCEHNCRCSHINTTCIAPHVQGADVAPRYSKSSLVWAFFETSASDRTAAICNICLKRICQGTNRRRTVRPVLHGPTSTVRMRAQRECARKWATTL